MEIHTAARVHSRRDFRTLVPRAGHLGDNIINEYLNCLTHYTNSRRESDILNTISCTNTAMIGTTDGIPAGLLKRLATFSTIYVPIKVCTHWTLAVLYPCSLGPAQGRAELYDSHKHWTSNGMTASNVLQFLKFRLGDEISPGDWTISAQQRSQPQLNDVDSGLHVLANAKSIALGLGMVEMDSDAQSRTLRWQMAQELLQGSVVEAF